MGGQAAEQIIAGVVLSERLAVTMYGAIHRAQWSGQRNLRGLVIDSKMLAEAAFRATLVSDKDIQTAISLEHPNIVPTVAVEHGGPDVVVVTRGGGRYVSVQDLITAAKANKNKDGGKLTLPVAAAIGKSVVEALAAAHKAKVVHGAVHPRSVLVDEDGGVRLGDFVNGRALTSAVAQGADSSLWRGLAGYLSPELVVGEDPTPAADVFACGAMLFTMLSGDVPPGNLHVTPAVERLVQRALDTDPSRRYKNAVDLLENMLEAFEDDRWDLAERGEVIKAAGLTGTDTNIDDATEDLLASLGTSANAMQVTPMRPSIDLRAEAIAGRAHIKTPTGSNRLEALLQDLDAPEHTAVEELHAFKRDPISELIQMDPRKKEAIVQVRSRVPSLDDPDDETPLPPPDPNRDSGFDILASPKRRSQSGDEAAALEAIAGLGGRAGSRPRLDSKAARPDELAAMDAIAGLDAPVRMSSAADAAELAVVKLEQAATRAEAAARRVETNSEATPKKRANKATAEAEDEPAPPAKPKARPVQPIVDPIAIDDAPPVRIKSRLPGIIGMLVIAGLIVGGIYLYTQRDSEAQSEAEKRKKEDEARKAEADRLSKQLSAAQADPGTIRIKSNPSQGGVWLKLGRSPLTTPMSLSSAMMHEIRVEGVDGFQAVDTQIVGAHWSGEKDKRLATLAVDLKPIGKDSKGKPAPIKLPVTPPKPPDATGFIPGRGPIHVDVNCQIAASGGNDSSKKQPCNAEVWLYVGVTDQVDFAGIPAGRPYEFRILKDGYLPGFVSITADEWRDPKANDNTSPIDTAKKLDALERTADLLPDPAAKDPKKGK